MRSKLIIRFLIAATLTAVSSCRVAQPDMNIPENMERVTVRIDIQPVSSAPTRTVTIPNTTLGNVENEINAYSIGIYDRQSGDLVYTDHIDGTASVNVLLQKGHPYSAVAIANLSDQATNLPEKYDDLDGMAVLLPASWDDVEYIPMSGRLEDFLPGDDIAVPVERLFAKVNLTLRISELGKTGVSNFPGQISVRDINRRLLPFNPDGCAALSQEDIIALGDSAFADQAIQTINHDNSEQVFTFYVPANMKGTLLPDNTDPYLKNETTLVRTRHERQQIETLTYLDYTCSVDTTPDALPFSGGLHYRFYLGADNVTNFDVEANTQYNVTLTLLLDTAITEADWKVEHDDDWNDLRSWKWRTGTTAGTWSGATLLPTTTLLAGNFEMIGFSVGDKWNPGSSSNGILYYNRTSQYGVESYSGWKWTESTEKFLERSGLEISWNKAKTIMYINAKNACVFGSVDLVATDWDEKHRFSIPLEIISDRTYLEEDTDCYIGQEKEFYIRGFSGTDSAYSVSAPDGWFGPQGSITGTSSETACLKMKFSETGTKKFTVTKNGTGETFTFIVTSNHPVLKIDNETDGIEVPVNGEASSISYSLYKSDGMTRLPRSSFSDDPQYGFCLVEPDFSIDNGANYGISTSTSVNASGYNLVELYVDNVDNLYTSFDRSVTSLRCSTGHVAGPVVAIYTKPLVDAGNYDFGTISFNSGTAVSTGNGRYVKNLEDGVRFCLAGTRYDTNIFSSTAQIGANSFFEFSNGIDTDKGQLQWRDGSIPGLDVQRMALGQGEFSLCCGVMNERAGKMYRDIVGHGVLVQVIDERFEAYSSPVPVSDLAVGASFRKKLYNGLKQHNYVITGTYYWDETEDKYNVVSYLPDGPAIMTYLPDGYSFYDGIDKHGVHFGMASYCLADTKEKYSFGFEEWRDFGDWYMLSNNLFNPSAHSSTLIQIKKHLANYEYLRQIPSMADEVNGTRMASMAEFKDTVYLSKTNVGDRDIKVETSFPDYIIGRFRRTSANYVGRYFYTCDINTSCILAMLGTAESGYDEMSEGECGISPGTGDTLANIFFSIDTSGDNSYNYLFTMQKLNEWFGKLGIRSEDIHNQ